MTKLSPATVRRFGRGAGWDTAHPGACGAGGRQYVRLGHWARGDVTPNIEVDFANEDHTGYIWVWLDKADDPALVQVGAVPAPR